MYRLENKYGIYFRQRIYLHTNLRKKGYIVNYTKVVYIICVVYVKYLGVFNIMCLIYSGIPVKC